MSHPFDRYSAYTDIAALKEFSSKPLRKCLRINTLKHTVEKFKEYAQSHNWRLEDIPWCDEGFFIDREDRSTPLGKNILHILGHTYMQEASSMLPVAMLNPEPGEKILDMAAAPGSKSTQIAARLQNSGVLVCNDMQEARLKTLREALRRLGIMNAIVTKKKGQWFGSNMVGRFDKVLIDAPCTGQGTARKDSTALQYCSSDSIGKNAKLQRELIESAVHATAIGGRIVYSTCTLTPEENEEVVLSILKKYPDQIHIVDPRTISDWDMEQAIEDSNIVQRDIHKDQKQYPMLRIWPHTYDSEGFFCAVLQKTGPTADPIRNDIVKPREEIIPRSRERVFSEYLTNRFGMDGIGDNEVVLQHEDRYLITTKDVIRFKLPTPNVGIGLPFGKKISSDPILLDHDFLTLRGSKATKNVIALTSDQLEDILQGKDSNCDLQYDGHVLMGIKGMFLARARAKSGVCKNQIPRWIVTMNT